MAGFARFHRSVHKLQMSVFKEFSLDSQNPLLINEIAERILLFVPVTHLKSCRLVCQLWWNESLARWRRTHWLHLSNYDSNAGRQDILHLRRNVEPDAIRMQKCLHIAVYISLLSDPLDPYKLKTQPFLKLKLFKSLLAFDSRKNEKLKELLTKSGPSVKFLELEQCSIPTADDFRKILLDYSPKLEYLSLSCNVYQKVRRRRKNQLENLNLETLVAKQSDVKSQLKYLKLGDAQHYSDGPAREDSFPLTWTEFFAHFPNVQNLEFVSLDERISNIHAILKSIHALRTQCGILQQIRGLDLLNLMGFAMSYSYTSVTRRLHTLSLPLTFFGYDIGYDQTFQLHHPARLRIATGTLETLVIYKGPFSAPFGSFPYRHNFPNLTKLTLVGPIVRDLQFLKKMPALKILRMFHRTSYKHEKAALWRPKVMKQLQTFPKDVDDAVVAHVPVIGNTDFSQLSHLTFPNLEEFLVEEENITQDHVESLARLMPNVKRFRIGLDNEGFRAICKYWKGLEALDIHPAHINDEGITGIVPGEVIRLPNITDLKYLKAFGLSDGAAKSEENSQFSDLTDLSLEQGLLQLKYLERVVVWCSLDKMSEENYQKFKSMFPPYPYCSINRDRTSYESDFEDNILSRDEDNP